MKKQKQQFMEFDGMENLMESDGRSQGLSALNEGAGSQYIMALCLASCL